MDIDELKNLYTKVLYQDTLDLDDDGARYNHEAAEICKAVIKLVEAENENERN